MSSWSDFSRAGAPRVKSCVLLSIVALATARHPAFSIPETRGPAQVIAEPSVLSTVGPKY